MRRINLELLVRFDSATQKNAIKKAADLRHWSMNRFLLEGAERLMDSDNLERLLNERRLSETELHQLARGQQLASGD